jgi:hypothetical protein
LKEVFREGLRTKIKMVIIGMPHKSKVDNLDRRRDAN